MIGVPPIAYTSLIALAAATCPNINGSSTIGVKKSVVEINASSSFNRYTAASSFEWLPTKSWESYFVGYPIVKFPLKLVGLFYSHIHHHL